MLSTQIGSYVLHITAEFLVIPTIITAQKRFSFSSPLFKKIFLLLPR